MKTLALFDFDGTITTKDTFTSFVKYYHGSVKFTAGFAFFSPLLVLMKLGVYDNELVKNMVFSYFFKGEDEHEFNEKCTRYCTEVLPNLIRDGAIEQINSHSENDDKIVIYYAHLEDVYTRENGTETVIDMMHALRMLITSATLEFVYPDNISEVYSGLKYFECRFTPKITVHMYQLKYFRY